MGHGCPEPEARSWSHETHGGSRAALCHEAGADATGRMTAPELPQAGTREQGLREVW
jgi:hypothetical protein